MTPERFWSRVARGAPDACWPWLGSLEVSGYGKISYRNRRRRVHCVAYELANGSPIPAGLFVCHSCDNPPCCNPAHLFLGTTADNMADMVAKGRAPQPLGERHRLAKVRAYQIPLIRARYAAGGTSYRLLAAEYGVTKDAIKKIVGRQTWRHVPEGEYDDARRYPIDDAEPVTVPMTDEERSALPW